MVGLKAPLSWLGRFGASASQAFMSCGFANPSVDPGKNKNVVRETIPTGKKIRRDKMAMTTRIGLI